MCIFLLSKKKGGGWGGGRCGSRIQFSGASWSVHRIPTGCAISRVTILKKNNCLLAPHRICASRKFVFNNYASSLLRRRGCHCWPTTGGFSRVSPWMFASASDTACKTRPTDYYQDNPVAMAMAHWDWNMRPPHGRAGCQKIDKYPRIE